MEVTMDRDLLPQGKDAWKRGGPDCRPSGHSELHPFSFLVTGPWNGFELPALAVYASKAVVHWVTLRPCEPLCWAVWT